MTAHITPCLPPSGGRNSNQLIFCALLLFASIAPCFAQSADKVPPAKAPTSRPAAKAAPKAGSAEFDKIVKTATDARLAERWDDAIALYAQAVKLKPDYVEGFWYQGTAYYTLDNHTQCRDAFRRVIRLAPKNGAAYAFLGLCEFGLKEYRPVAPRPAPVAYARGRRCARARWDRPLSRGPTHDAGGTVRAGSRDARRVRRGRKRQPARDRGDGPRHAAHGAPAD